MSPLELELWTSACGVDDFMLWLVGGVCASWLEALLARDAVLLPKFVLEFDSVDGRRGRVGRKVERTSVSGKSWTPVDSVRCIFVRGHM